MFCRKCGNGLKENEHVCNICGEDNSKKETNVALITVIGLIGILLCVGIYIIYSNINKVIEDYNSTTITTKSREFHTTKRKTESINHEDNELERPVANGKVNLYIFYGSTCQYCKNLHDYIDKLKSDSTINYMFNVVDYEVWGNMTNNELMMRVAEKIDYDVKGVPFYIIGEEVFSGYSEKYNDKIREHIKKAYHNKDTKDIVLPIIEEMTEDDR